MSARIIRTSIVVAAFILVGAAFAQAEPVNVKINFKFIAGTKTFEPGTYAVDVASDGKVVLTADKGTAVELAQVKALGHKKNDRLELAFDEMGSVMYLSEVWMPEKDGIRVATVDGSERRVTVNGPKNAAPAPQSGK